ncbi:transglutaminase domain-containing protein [Chitinophaga sp. Cy-1792]|uniref:transglutaminase domain-containing protein n=1 Tax=Chitinophaga sp. Cy-1792 TaxID=2608339 RepID=UPI00141EB61C|nr:transglutaminase domain-containing protein [Chitinophaga sp. Cy-1792]NIG57090.1 hypothetical protein [Chitinophaga sp. Cy-1792]
MKVANILILLLLCSLLPSNANCQNRDISDPNYWSHYKDTAKPLPFLQIPAKVITTPKEIGKWLQTNCSNEIDRLKAIYAWMGSHIFYDYPGMKNLAPYRSIYELSNKTLRTRKGVCDNYASLFWDIANAAGISTYKVSGYTRVGEVVDTAAGHGHAWNAVNVNNKWYIIDATWGAATDKTTGKNNFNWFFFMLPPEKAIRIFIPTDPLFQFLTHPFTHTEIALNDWQHAASRPIFAFEDTLRRWPQLDSTTWVRNQITRIEKYKASNNIVVGELQYLKNLLDIYIRNEEVDRYNKSIK